MRGGPGPKPWHLGWRLGAPPGLHPLAKQVPRGWRPAEAGSGDVHRSWGTPRRTASRCGPEDAPRCRPGARRARTPPGPGGGLVQKLGPPAGGAPRAPRTLRAVPRMRAGCSKVGRTRHQPASSTSRRRSSACNRPSPRGGLVAAVVPFTGDMVALHQGVLAADGRSVRCPPRAGPGSGAQRGPACQHTDTAVFLTTPTSGQ